VFSSTVHRINISTPTSGLHYCFFSLIQRFGHSNPSPRFQQSVAEAFRSGEYQSNDQSFGTGNYGDLAATVAAILLDRESRNVLLDLDSSHGSIREPIIKFLSLMRNMGYLQTFNKDFGGLFNAEGLLGEGPYEVPNIFSFFPPEFSPPGPVSRAKLVAPDAVLLHKATGLMNALFSLVKFG